MYSGTHWDTNKNMPDLTGKVAIVTGGNTGIGKESVRRLALHNAKVYMASRSETRAMDAIQDLKKYHPELAEKPEISFLHLDLTSLESCMKAASTFLEKEDRLDILINNAAIMGSPYELTADGFEIQFQSNHLGHFAFTLRLLPLLIKTCRNPYSSVRIVQITSDAHSAAPSNTKFDSVESVNRDFGNAIRRYLHSKLANVLFAKELDRRLSNERIFCTVVHPGLVWTEIGRGFAQSYPYLNPFYRVASFIVTVPPYRGAISQLYAATAPEIEEKNMRGAFIIPYAKLAEPSKQSQDPQLARDLWDLSAKIVKEKTGYSYPGDEV